MSEFPGLNRANSAQFTFMNIHILYLIRAYARDMMWFTCCIRIGDANANTINFYAEAIRAIEEELPIPQFPEIPKPELPTLPKPEVPTLPKLKMPVIPKPKLPTLPKPEIPQVPKMP
ncbi:hypothetical protein H5410_019676 [Solanum commersonii]|uniref:Uncharacterized protein n=1 Tax=Solanum commersonii TaxID=4109 RepID=A0A9J5Z5W9_SOLCO|nr:hypothetical protein H5410_019676 [Solanum commersonii]